MMDQREYLEKTDDAAQGRGPLNGFSETPEVLTADQTENAALPTNLQTIVEEDIASVVPQAVLIAGWGRVVTWYLFRFAARITAYILDDTVADWLKNLDRSDHYRVLRVNKRMERAGFADYTHGKVFAGKEFVFYGIGNEAGDNLCVPFFVRNRSGHLQKSALVGGPIIIGLSLGSRDWPRQSEVNRADGLIPRHAITSGAGEFARSMASPFISHTNAGYVFVDYKAYPRNRSGLIRVKAKQRNGQWLFRKNYHLHWPDEKSLNP
jgi:hypothetical protein